ncbi:hypothetical protein [Fredinandcohnia quinoae]|uniref:Uncharacterized protein n=1 Tax=Fredinandcohnia quinoae TaxID=2918902 RepID=A0AAW5E3F9_9BACI|nr:hypothetical protein [Fredinandcohnia sp. SECRCQ15]MCH1624531.1 hypothetical protein [Fredinandcohnia sp. SECRCQ15]
MPNHNKKQAGNYAQGSGSKYHQEHASHVPDYGANIVDPNTNMSEKSNK